MSSNGEFEDLSIFFEDDKLLEDLLVDFPAIKSLHHKVQENNNSNRTAHKLIEKHRRKSMSALYASLRSLLPLEYVKGKRAVSDHMAQAANYIDDMKKKIEQMKIKRDNLRKSSNAAEDQNSARPCDVKINHLFRHGLEILISTSLSKEGFPLSMVLADLSDRRQLNVINCVSTRGNRCYLHKIQIEMNDESTSIDLSELQEGLVKLIKHA